MTVLAQKPGYGPSTPVPIFQFENEFLELLALYRDRKPRRVLEVGTYHGGTFYHWLANAEPGAFLVSVDRYHLVDNSWMYGEWCPPGVEYAVVRGDSGSRETAEATGAFGPFDWIFIDAGHLDREVRRDWELYGPMCSPSGVVVLHDIRRDDEYPHIQVWRLWDELAEKLPHRVIGTDTGVVYL